MSDTCSNLSINLFDPHNNPKRKTFLMCPHFTHEKTETQVKKLAQG